MFYTNSNYRLTAESSMTGSHSISQFVLLSPLRCDVQSRVGSDEYSDVSNIPVSLILQLPSDVYK